MQADIRWRGVLREQSPAMEELRRYFEEFLRGCSFFCKGITLEGYEDKLKRGRGIAHVSGATPEVQFLVSTGEIAVRIRLVYPRNSHYSFARPTQQEVYRALENYRGKQLSPTP